ncbi:MAG: ankyrin repeat domain-containing protein [Armatimonadota bacterium]
MRPPHQRYQENAREAKEVPIIAETEAHDRYGFTPLLIAARRCDSGIVSLLIEKGGNLGRRNITGKTALVIAAEIGCSNVVKLLLANGADPEIRDGSGVSAVRLAKAAGHSEVVKLLNAAGAIG